MRSIGFLLFIFSFPLWGGDIQWEIRLPLNHLGYAKLLQFGDYRDIGKRHDIYFDAFHGKGFRFRANPKLPIKIRLKHYEDGTNVWQVSKRLLRTDLKGTRLPFTLTKIDSYETEVTKGAEAFDHAENYLWSLYREDEDLENHLSAFEAAMSDWPSLTGRQIYEAKLDEGDFFAPVYVNTKRRLKKQISLTARAFPFNFQLRKNTYWLSRNVGHTIFELEVEPLGITLSKKALLESGQALDEIISALGITSDDIETEVYNSCTVSLAKLRQWRVR